MYFQQFYLGCLSHASYLIGSGGIAAVVDPQRDVGIYIEDAVKHGLKIEHVIETHLHADFISGHGELAALTGASIYLGAQAGAKFPHAAVKDGDELRFGHCVLRFLETPGHTLESISILVTDTETSPGPALVLTGDTLFIGDVGRPDLAPDMTPQQLAGLLYESLWNKLMTLPDAVAVYPAHGAGSLCGRQMSAERSSTIGQQRTANFALQAKSKEEFVRLLTAELPERPGYFAQDAELNRSGPTPLGDLPVPDALTPADGAAAAGGRRAGVGHASGDAVRRRAYSGRDANRVASGTVRVLGRQADRPRSAVDSGGRGSGRDAGGADAAGAGGDRKRRGVSGWWNGGMVPRGAAGGAQVAQITVQDLHREFEHVTLIDVRQPGEAEQMRIEGAVLKPLPKLTSLVAGMDCTAPVAVHCKSGYRSSIASSLLARAGFTNVMNVIGGIDAWNACGLPLVK